MLPTRTARLALLVGLLALPATGTRASEATADPEAPARRPRLDRLATLTDCRLLPTEWADGDSFRVRCAEDEPFTVRLYAVDCIERSIHDDLDARRLIEQARHFGIADAKAARQVGRQAWVRVQEALADTPFTVHTAFADGRGDSRYRRYYAFVTTAPGDDLGAVLVREGLARAHGVRRRRPDGVSREEYGRRLADLELTAARRGVGAWKLTDWERLADDRSRQRAEEDALQRLQGSDRTEPRASAGIDAPLDVNHASRDELMRLPGIGEVLANRIIENRPYGKLDDLLDVPGIGAKKFERIRPLLEIR